MNRSPHPSPFRWDAFEWGVLAVVFSLALAGAAALGWFTPPPASPAAATPTAGVAASVVASPLPTATPSPAPVLSPAPGTATPAPPPTLPAATATWFYIAPYTLAFDPTPVLPPAAPFPASCDGPGRMNILLVGLDGFDANYARPARADTLILVGVNFASKTAQMVSFPRDLWVTLANGLPVTEARLNTAYHYGELYGVAGGGPEELKATLTQNFGLRIDRYVVVSFTAFEQGVDAIGGIEIDVPEPIRDPNYPMRSREGTMAIEFPAGRVQMNGATALIYARIRHDSSDFQRMRRQQQVLFAVRDKLLQPSTLPHWPGLAQVMFNSVRTDLSLEDLALLGCAGAQINTGAIQSWVIDSRLTQASTTVDGAQILLPKLDAIQPILQAFNTGE